MPRLPLPYTDDILLAWIDPGEGVLYSPGSLNVYSVLNRINGKGATQLNAGMQPTWSATAMNGTPGLVFSGGQRLTIDLPLVTLGGVGVPITFCMGWGGGTSNDAVFGIPLTLGSKTLPNPEFLILPLSTSVDLNRLHDGNLVDLDDLFYVFDNSKPHILTGIFDGSQMILRVDGVQVATLATTHTGNRQVSIDQLALGDLTDGAVAGPQGHDYYNGVVGPVLVYKGSTPPIDAEKALMEMVGL